MPKEEKYRDCIEWRLSNFESIGLSHRKLFSPVHTLAADRRTGSSKWKLMLVTHEVFGRAFVALYLVLVSCDSKEVDVQFQFSIIDNENRHRNAMGTDYYSKFTADMDDKNHGFDMFILRDELISPSVFLNDGDLHFSCLLEIKIPAVELNPLCDVDTAKLGFYFSRCMCESLWQQYVDQKYTDVKFVVGDQEFNLHKLVMASCPIFKLMFDSELKEGRENLVTISDVDPEVFLEMVRYIYTGNVENLEGVAKRLIVVADKYAIEDLVKECEGDIAKNLSVENAAESFQVAQILGLTLLKKYVLQFIGCHPVDVMKTEGYQNLTKDQVIEVAQYLAESIVQSRTPGASGSSATLS